MNFQTIHTAIKTRVKESGFRYWEAQDWVDLEIGKLPEAAMQDGFAIRFINQETSEISDNIGRVTIEVEFAFKPQKDIYTASMGIAQTVVRDLRQEIDERGITTIDDSIYPNWSMQYLGEIVVMTFTINFEVNSD